MRALTDSEMEMLDAMVHRTSVKHVLEALAQLCFSENERISSSCESSDEFLGRFWKRAGDQLMRTADTRAIHGIEP